MKLVLLKVLKSQSGNEYQKISLQNCASSMVFSKVLLIFVDFIFFVMYVDFNFLFLIFISVFFDVD